MKKSIQYNWGEDFLEIDLGNRVESRARTILVMELVITIAMATVFLLRAFQMEQGLISFLLCLGACMLYGIASYRFISRISFREKLIITESHLAHVKRTPVAKKYSYYDWRCVGTLHYIGKDIRTQHSLLHSYDPFGLDRNEKLALDLHHEGNLFFFYKEQPIRFARGIYSWHAEEIVRMIQLYTGSSLKLGAEWEYLMETSDWEE